MVPLRACMHACRPGLAWPAQHMKAMQRCKDLFLEETKTRRLVWAPSLHL